MRLSATAFTLAPGEARSVSATLLSEPRSGSLHGALDVMGTPQDARARSGIQARYRLLGGLRLNPSDGRRRLRVRVGRLVEALAAPWSPSAARATPSSRSPDRARISGAAGKLRPTIAGQRILLGAVVDLRLGRQRLQSGRYTAVVTLRDSAYRVGLR